MRTSWWRWRWTTWRPWRRGTWTRRWPGWPRRSGWSRRSWVSRTSWRSPSGPASPAAGGGRSAPWCSPRRLNCDLDQQRKYINLYIVKCSSMGGKGSSIGRIPLLVPVWLFMLLISLKPGILWWWWVDNVPSKWVCDIPPPRRVNTQMPPSHRSHWHDASISANQRPVLEPHWPIRGRDQWGVQGEMRWTDVIVSPTWQSISRSQGNICVINPGDKHEVRGTKTENWL